MSKYIDEKYINIVANYLELPKRKGNSELVARCPVCGDSQKNKYKRRFGISSKQDGAVCGCFNCGYAAPFSKFLKDYYPDIYNDYKLETFRESAEYSTQTKSKPSKSSTGNGSLFNRVPESEKTIASPVIYNKDAVEYLKSRAIPEDRYDSFVWAYDFKEVLEKLTKTEYEHIDEGESRLVILLRNFSKKLVGLQSRSLDAKNTKRYEIHKIGNDNIIWVPRWIDISKPIIVTEGVFDAISTVNGIAKLSNHLTSIDNKLDSMIYAWDNEPENEFIVSRMSTAVKSNYRVFIPGSGWYYKDLNDALKDGLTIDEIQEYVEKNSYTGLRLNLNFNKWKKS
jgi:hypothetical protein